MHSVRQPRKCIVSFTFPERIAYKMTFNHFESELTKEDNSLSYLHILHKLKKGMNTPYIMSSLREYTFGS